MRHDLRGRILCKTPLPEPAGFNGTERTSAGFGSVEALERVAVRRQHLGFRSPLSYFHNGFAHGVAEVAHATLREQAAELGGAAEPGQARELAAQCLHLGRAIEAEQPAELGRRVFLEWLGALDP
jgi:hypothetical protein